MSHDSLAAAMLAVQGAAPTMPKDATNPHFHSKYTPLDTIVEVITPLLFEHGLVWTTLPSRDEHGDPSLKYRLIHAATNQALEGEMPLLLVKADPQGQGSALTYARRYAVCAVLNLVGDEDDDGNSASRSPAQRGAASKRPASRPAKPAAPPRRAVEDEVKSPGPATVEEIGRLYQLSPWDENELALTARSTGLELADMANATPHQLEYVRAALLGSINGQPVEGDGGQE